MKWLNLGLLLAEVDLALLGGYSLFRASQLSGWPAYGQGMVGLGALVAVGLLAAPHLLLVTFHQRWAGYLLGPALLGVLLVGAKLLVDPREIHSVRGFFVAPVVGCALALTQLVLRWKVR